MRVVKKYDIVNLLSAKYGFHSYLEISTPTTGWFHSKINRQQLTKCHRFVYGLPDESETDLRAEFRTSLLTSSEIVKSLLVANDDPLYDVVFVDPYHGYANSYEDIVGGFNLVRPGGFMVVHDCNPPSAELAAPEFKTGQWCGVTYWAYIDFVLGRSNIRYYTVDSDWGCGVIYKQPASPPDDALRLELDWAAAVKTDAGRFRFFEKHRHRLLNMISVEEFLALEGLQGAAADAAETPLPAA